MKKFRVTLFVVCMLLGWLGYNDLSLFIRNQAPQQISIVDLEIHGPGREWLQIDNGYQDLLQAINMSGTMEIDSFLVPLKSALKNPETYVWFETRDPIVIELLKTYYFKLDTDLQRKSFLQENHDTIYARRQITGMTMDNLVASSNHEKLKELLQTMNMSVPENVIFISEGKQPASLRGFFFAAMALIGVIKLATSLKSTGKKQS